MSETFSDYPVTVGPKVPGVVLLTLGPDGKTPVATPGGLRAAPPLPASPVNRSSVIAVAGVAQEVAPSNAARRGFFLQNLSAGDLWISLNGVASSSPGSYRIGPSGTFDATSGVVPSGAISIFGATVGQAFTATEF